MKRSKDVHVNADRKCENKKSLKGHKKTIPDIPSND